MSQVQERFAFVHCRLAQMQCVKCWLFLRSCFKIPGVFTSGGRYATSNIDCPGRERDRTPCVACDPGRAFATGGCSRLRRFVVGRCSGTGCNPAKSSTEPLARRQYQVGPGRFSSRCGRIGGLSLVLCWRSPSRCSGKSPANKRERRAHCRVYRPPALCRESAVLWFGTRGIIGAAGS